MPESPADFVAGVSAAAAGIGLILTGFSLARRVRADQREAARKVWALWERWSYASDGSDREGMGAVILVNGSDEPILECSLRVLRWDAASSDVPGSVVTGRIIPTLRPGTDSQPLELYGIPAVPPTARRANSHEPRNPPLELDFTDGRGIRWRRQRNGKLKRRRRLLHR